LALALRLLPLRLLSLLLRLLLFFLLFGVSTAWVAVEA
jgi:hypothetical protein